jgi:hypothetical protein
VVLVVEFASEPVIRIFSDETPAAPLPVCSLEHETKERIKNKETNEVVLFIEIIFIILMFKFN